MVDAEDFVRCQNKDDLVDLVRGAEDVARGFNRDVRSFRQRIAIRTTTNCRERDRVNLVLDRDPQRIAITTSKSFRFAPISSGPNRPNGMNNEARRQIVSPRNFRVTRPTTAKDATLLQ